MEPCPPSSCNLPDDPSNGTVSTPDPEQPTSTNASVQPSDHKRVPPLPRPPTLSSCRTDDTTPISAPTIVGAVATLASVAVTGDDRNKRKYRKYVSYAVSVILLIFASVSALYSFTTTKQMFQGTKVQAIEWLKTTADPKHYQYNPPNLRTIASFNQNFTVLGKHVADDTALVGDKISTATGVFLWFVNRGLKSLYNFGIVPMGTVSAEAPLINYDSMTAYAINLRYNSELILPYSEASGKQPVVGPDPATSFSFVRQIGGVLNVYTDTTPSGVFALNGKVTAGTIQDTRDIMQRRDPGSSLPAKTFTQTDICQQSLTNKDQFAAEKVFNGVTFTIGSDVELDYSVPDRDNYYTKAEAATEVQLTALMAGFQSTYDSANPFEAQHEIFSSFSSPWDVQVVNPGRVFGATAPDPFEGFSYFSNYELPNINVCGDVKIDVSLLMRASINDDTLLTTGIQTIQIRCSCIHVFASLNGDGSIRTDQAGTEEQMQVFIGQSPLADDTTGVITTNCPLYAPLNGQTLPTSSQPPKYADHRLRFTFEGIRKPTSLSEHGMYIGSFIRAYYMINSPVPPTGRTGKTVVNGSLQISFPQGRSYMRYAPQNIYAPGELGPCRVLRYDELSDKMDLQFTGDLLVECVPQGQIAPYVKQGGQVSGITTAPSVFPLISAIYNSNRCPVKRVWMHQDYLDFINNVVPTLSTETVLQWMDENPAIKEVVMSEAGGSFGNILGSIGGRLGESAGNALGGALGGLFGSAGQYGSAGQFAAGQYGASGIYGDALNPVLSGGQSNAYRLGANYSQDGTAARRRLR